METVIVIDREKNVFIVNGCEYPATYHNASLYKRHLYGEVDIVDLFSDVVLDLT